MRPRTTLALGMVAAAWSALAHAQLGSAGSAWSPSSEKHEQARRDLAAGQRLLKRERFEEALGKLQAAYAAEPSGAALLGIALAERETDRLPEAYRSYEKVLGEPAAELTPDERDRAQRALAELAGVSGVVKLTAVDPGAAYAVDDRPLDADTLGHPLHLSAGRHVLAVSKPGFEPLVFPVWITVGKVLETSLTPKPKAGAAPPSVPPPVPAAPASSLSPPPPVPIPVASPPVRVPVTPPAAPTAPPLAPAPAPFAPPPAAGPSAPPGQAPSPLPASPPLAPSPSPPPLAPAAPPPSAVAPVPPAALLPEAAPLPPASVAPPPVGPPLPEPTHESPPPLPGDASADVIRVGFLLGLVTLPRPLEGELVVKLGPSFALGLKGSLLPELSVPGIDGKLDLKAVEGVARWFPGGGLFFLGAGFGYQSFKASLGEIVDSNELTISADMSGFFVQPQLGVLWIAQAGLAISLSVGLQIPIPKDPVVTASYEGQPVPAQATSTIPQDVVDEANLDKSNVQSVARFIVKYPFPTLDLFRVGIFF